MSSDKPGLNYWRSKEDEAAWLNDFLVYGNAFAHHAMIDGKLVIRRLDPKTVKIEGETNPLADDAITS
jgi:hypothetical protein